MYNIKRLVGIKIELEDGRDINNEIEIGDACVTTFMNKQVLSKIAEYLEQQVEEKEAFNQVYEEDELTNAESSAINQEIEMTVGTKKVVAKKVVAKKAVKKVAKKASKKIVKKAAKKAVKKVVAPKAA